MVAQLNTDIARQNINDSFAHIASITTSIASNPQNKDLTQDLRRHSLMALMMVEGMRDILNDLSYDEEVIQTLIDNLDDGYDALNASMEQYKFDGEIYNTVDKLLTQLTGLINDLQTLSIEKANEINLTA